MRVKNRIITISGEPVTGKGTNVKAIEEKLLNRGYKKDNIHIITTGHEFRKYFEIIIELVRNIDNDDVLKKLQENEKIKSIFNNAEYRNRFTKELAKLKKSGKDFSQTLSIEQANNTPELAGIREIVDTIIDKNIEKLGIEINKKERKNEVWIIDSRLAFSNIPDSFKVRLTCLPHVAGQRLLGDNTRGKEDREYKDLQDAINQREKRRIGEIERYKQRYNVDLSDEKNYDLIIDTSFASINDISDTILTCLDRYQNGEYVAKRWTSPKMLIPAQHPCMTFTPRCEDFKEVKKSIAKNGFDQSYDVEAVRIDGILYLDNGHKRTFSSGMAGKTLVPYYLLNENVKGGKGIDKKDVESARKAEERVKREVAATPIQYLYDHEDAFGGGFRYTTVYPDLMKKLEKIKEDVKKLNEKKKAAKTDDYMER